MVLLRQATDDGLILCFPPGRRIAGLLNVPKRAPKECDRRQLGCSCAVASILVKYRGSAAYAVAITDFLTNEAHDSIPEHPFSA